MSDKSGWVGAVLAIAVIGGAIVGMGSVVVALMSVFEGDWAGAGTCLIAAALSFGLLARALIED